MSCGSFGFSCGGLVYSMLVSEHDMRLVQELFPRTVVMDDGQIVADGLTMEILEDEELLNAHGLEKPGCDGSTYIADCAAGMAGKLQSG